MEALGTDWDVSVALLSFEQWKSSFKREHPILSQVLSLIQLNKMIPGVK